MVAVPPTDVQLIMAIYIFFFVATGAGHLYLALLCSRANRLESIEVSTVSVTSTATSAAAS